MQGRGAARDLAVDRPQGWKVGVVIEGVRAA